MTVHNHGTEDGPGLACPERRINGKPRGECMTSMAIPDEAVEAAAKAFIEHGTLLPALEAAAPHIAAHVLREAVEAFPLETITAPDNAVMWLMRRADELNRKAERA